MWYTRYIDFFSFSCAQGNINILEPWTGVPCDSLQRALSDCVHDRVDDIIKYSYFLLELEWKYELTSGLAWALLRSARLWLKITTRLQLQSLPKTLTQPVTKLHWHANQCLSSTTERGEQWRKVQNYGHCFFLEGSGDLDHCHEKTNTVCSLCGCIVNHCLLMVRVIRAGVGPI